ncbi:zinc finger domain-containing protein [Amycolatopsis lexingtonensis]|uniref:zinc finger domain-containing protein n=1 Tax=Amycolatopsis lexingtonensis TaxID=218822 RepID=UPI003F72A032
MNRQEVTQLLGAASAVDQYAPQPDELVLRIWTSMLADIPMAAAEQALMAHYRATKDTITPADIAGWYRDRRRYAPVERKSPPADPQVIRNGIDRVFTALAAKKALAAAERSGGEVDLAEVELAVESDVAARRAWLGIRCPVESCRAAAGQRCTTNGKPMQKSPCHPARMEAAFAAESASRAL